MNELAPLYSNETLESCAASDEYCFLCSSIDDGVDGEAASIRTFVAELVRQNKEINHIVSSIDEIYRTEICGEQPWSTSSIRRHLLFSTEFVGLFHNVVDQIFQALIMRIQASAVDENGMVPEHIRKGLLETLEKYGKWQTTAKNLREQPRRA